MASVIPGSKSNGPTAKGYFRVFWPYYLAVAIPPAIVLWLISSLSVNVPFFDQWGGFVDTLYAAHSGHLTISHLWGQHNEHRLVFPKIIMLGLAALSGWNVIWEQYAGVIVHALSLMLLIRLVRLTTRNSTRPDQIVFASVASILLFSMVQAENWAFGWQLQIFLNIFGAIFSTWAITAYPDRWIGLLLAALGATVATYSFANGLIVWAIVPLSLMASRSHQTYRFLAGWLSLALLVVSSYLFGYSSPGHHPSLLSALKQPSQFLVYSFSYIGAPFGTSFGVLPSAIIGLFGIAMGGYLVFRIHRSNDPGSYRRGHPWIGLMLYILFSALVTGIGRVGFGADQSLASRYSTFSLVYWVAMAGLFTAGSPPIPSTRGPAEKIIRQYAIAIAFVGLAAVYGMAYAHGISYFKNRCNYLERVSQLLRFGHIYGDRAVYQNLHPSPLTVMDSIDKLKRMKAGPFHRNPPNPYDIYIYCGAFALPEPSRPLSLGQSGALVMAPGAQISFEFNILNTGYYQFSSENWVGADTGSLAFHFDGEPALPQVDNEKTTSDGAQPGRFSWIGHRPVYFPAGPHVIHIENKKGPSLLKAITIKAVNGRT